MDIFTKQEFLKLAEVHGRHCISLYIPTHRYGGDDAELQDMTRFKNQLKEVKRKLKEYKMTDNEISAYTQPLDNFLQMEGFWRKLSDTLVVFLHGSELSYYILPIQVSEANEVADHFFLKPLAPLLSKSHRFFIMTLSLGHTRFYDASEHSITEVEVEGLIPREMDESISLSTEENQQQLPRKSHQATGQADRGATFHGQGGSNFTDKKRQIQTYFKEIDQGLMKMLHDEKAPLIIAGVDYLFPIYKEVNNYKFLYDHHLVGNFDHIQPAELHNRVWDLIKDDYKADLDRKKDRYQELLKVDKAAYKLEEVIPGSIVGRTDTLFLERNKDIWGQYDSSDHSIKIEEEKSLHSADLLNRAAICTIQNGGEVYLLDSALMPDNASAAAIFRYEMK